MRKSLTKAAGIMLVAVAMSLPLAGAAHASDGSGFSQHVRACSQGMGFDGTHNPGVMHRGYSGWDPSHVC